MCSSRAPCVCFYFGRFGSISHHKNTRKMSNFSTGGHRHPGNPAPPRLAVGGAPLMFVQPEKAAEEKVGTRRPAGWLAGSSGVQLISSTCKEKTGGGGRGGQKGKVQEVVKKGRTLCARTAWVIAALAPATWQRRHTKSDSAAVQDENSCSFPPSLARSLARSPPSRCLSLSASPQ